MTPESSRRSATCDQLQTPNGLFDHFTLRGESGSFGPGWGRGQGWAILGLLEVLDSVDAFAGPDASGGEDWADARASLAASGRHCSRAMVALQRPTATGIAVVTDPDSGDEFSTAGFMAYAMTVALTVGHRQRLRDVGGPRPRTLRHPGVAR